MCSHTASRILNSESDWKNFHLIREYTSVCPPPAAYGEKNECMMLLVQVVFNWFCYEYESAVKDTLRLMHTTIQMQLKDNAIQQYFQNSVTVPVIGHRYIFEYR